MNSRGPRISSSTARKLIKLLHMQYKPSEIAEIMGVSVDTIYRSYLPAGAPFEKDAKNNIWIVGDVFASWAIRCAKTNVRKPEKQKLTSEQVFCLKCNQIVALKSPKKSQPNTRGVLNLSGKCPVCNTKVNRFCRASEFAG